MLAVNASEPTGEPMIVWWSEEVEGFHKWSAMPKVIEMRGFMKQRWADPDNCAMPGATHWMPLPDPPR